MTNSTLEAVLRRDRLVVAGAVGVIVALAWGYLLWLAADTDMGGMDMTGFRMMTMRHEFYLSPKWLNSRARYQAIKAARGACQACGARKSDGAKLVVDHIKPVRHYWHLRFAADNLQVLCEPCNLGKGSWDQTDWRCSPDIGSSVSSTTSS